MVSFTSALVVAFVRSFEGTLSLLRMTAGWHLAANCRGPFGYTSGQALRFAQDDKGISGWLTAADSNHAKIPTSRANTTRVVGHPELWGAFDDKGG